CAPCSQRRGRPPNDIHCRHRTIGRGGAARRGTAQELPDRPPWQNECGALRLFAGTARGQGRRTHRRQRLRKDNPVEHPRRTPGTGHRNRGRRRTHRVRVTGEGRVPTPEPYRHPDDGGAPQPRLGPGQGTSLVGAIRRTARTQLRQALRWPTDPGGTRGGTRFPPRGATARRATGQSGPVGAPRGRGRSTHRGRRHRDECGAVHPRGRRTGRRDRSPAAALTRTTGTRRRHGRAVEPARAVRRAARRTTTGTGNRHRTTPPRAAVDIPGPPAGKQRGTGDGRTLDPPIRHPGGPCAGTSHSKSEGSAGMSVPTVETPNNTTDTATNRRRVTWRDLILLGWQQHRMLVTGTGIIAFIGAGLMTLLSIVLAKGGIDIPIPVFSSLRQPAQLLERCIAGYGAVVAVFWAAPLLAREYEQRTHLFAWAQDVSALRWLVAKTLLLATVATGFAALLGSL